MEPFQFPTKIGTLSQEVLSLFPNEGSLFTENMRRATAESHAKLGRREISDRLYRGWLEADPAWGWGWIGFSDTYFLVVPDETRDAERAEAILREGLAVADVRDRHDILHRLADICEDMGRKAEGAEVRREAEALEALQLEPSVTLTEDPRTGSRTVSFDFGDEGPSLERLPEIRDLAHETLAATGAEVPRTKVGRNEPCPCGSGRKYKKCCGR